jgi:hypothetical protein
MDNFLLLLDYKDDYDNFNDFELVDEANNFVDIILVDIQEKQIRYN